MSTSARRDLRRSSTSPARPTSAASTRSRSRSRRRCGPAPPRGRTRPHERRARVRGPRDHAAAQRTVHAREPAGRVPVDDRRSRRDRPGHAIDLGPAERRPRPHLRDVPLQRHGQPDRARRSHLRVLARRRRLRGLPERRSPTPASPSARTRSRCARSTRRRQRRRDAGEPQLDGRRRDAEHGRGHERRGRPRRRRLGDLREVTAAGVTSLDAPGGDRRRFRAGYSSAGALFFDVSTTATFVGDVEVCLPYDRVARRAAPDPLRRQRVGRRDDSSSTRRTGSCAAWSSSLSPFASSRRPALSPETDDRPGARGSDDRVDQGGAEVQFQFDSPTTPLAEFECAARRRRLELLRHARTSSRRRSASTRCSCARYASPAPSTSRRPATPGRCWHGRSRRSTRAPRTRRPPSRTSRTRAGRRPSVQLRPGRARSSAASPARPPARPGSRARSAKTYENLALDEYTFEVQAINAAGHASLIPPSSSGRSPTSRPPDTTIHGGPTGPTSATSATFTFSANEPATFECSLDGAPLAPAARALTYTISAPAPTPSGPGDGSLRERERRARAGGLHVDGRRLDGAERDHGPGAAGDRPRDHATFTFTASRQLAGAVTVTCRLDAAALAAVHLAERRIQGLSPGDHTFEVRATDGAGNVGGGRATTWEVLDTIAPRDRTSPVMTGLADHRRSPARTTTRRRTTSTSSAASTAPPSPPAPARRRTRRAAQLTPAPHTFQVRAFDAAGNMDATPAS